VNQLRTISRDLVDRRLWPVAAVLALALVAIPVLFLRPAPSALESAPAAAPAPAATAAAPAAASAAAPAATTDLAGDPSVGMTSSPFAAAFGEGTKLPPAMQGLLKASEGPDDRKAVASSPLKDPFAVAASASTETAPAAPAPAPAASTTPAAAQTEAPQSAPIQHPSTQTSELTPDTSVPTSTPADDGTKTIYHADVRFGTVETPPMVKDTRRLTAFPSSFDPIAVYLGVMRGGWGAAFALRDGVQPIGAPSCRPRKQICTWVILHPGESVTLSVKDATTGAVTPYKLTLAAIRETTVTPEAAKDAAGRVSVAGRCLLGPLAAYRYDTESGTLAPRPELQACRYAGPGSDDGSAAGTVRSAHIG
jgi:hypothetical protein